LRQLEQSLKPVKPGFWTTIPGFLASHQVPLDLAQLDMQSFAEACGHFGHCWGEWWGEM
jgi:hypothetical protein